MERGREGEGEREGGEERKRGEICDISKTELSSPHSPVKG